MKKFYQISNGVALVITVIINYLSNTGIFNGETMATISAKYQNLFTPAGYAFSIWGLIYLGLFGFVIYFGPFVRQTNEKDKVVLKVGWWFLISCLANSLWVITWLYDYTFLTILLMVLLFVSLLKIIYYTQTIAFHAARSKRIFLKIPFQLYAGWISVALIAQYCSLSVEDRLGWFWIVSYHMGYYHGCNCINHSLIDDLATSFAGIWTCRRMGFNSYFSC